MTAAPTSPPLYQGPMLSSSGFSRGCATARRRHSHSERAKDGTRATATSAHAPISLHRLSHGRQISPSVRSYISFFLSFFPSPHETMNTLRQICFHSLRIRDSQLLFLHERARVCASQIENKRACARARAPHLCIHVQMCV